ncbi:hypothetical protein GQ43DRAFT_376818, partial [Delitschia confertaspora ATCC 74209]
ELASADEILMKARNLNTFQRPSRRDYRNIRIWFWNEKPLCYEPEAEYIRRKEDLLTIRHGREWAGFDSLIEDLVRKLPRRFTRLTSVGNRNNIFDAIWILVVFTLLFSAAMSLLTKARHHELFAASAAYCAVLVVLSVILVDRITLRSSMLQRGWDKYSGICMLQ